MTPSKENTNINLRSSDWELDFYSKPILEKDGKKRWELIISSTKTFENKDPFFWNKVCPANNVNSIWLTEALREALLEAEKKGWDKPFKVRYWRSSMKSIIKKSLENVEIEPLVSRRTYTLLDRMKYLENEIYPKEKGFIQGVLAPTFSSQVTNEAKPLPEAVRGDALTISEVSILELRGSQSWPIEFGDIFPINEYLDNNLQIPGLRLFSKNRALALAAWFSSLEPVKLIVKKNQLILEASEDDKWLVTDLPNKEANSLQLKFEEGRKDCYGYQFISVQTTPFEEKFEGFWLLRDIDFIL